MKLKILAVLVIGVGIIFSNQLYTGKKLSQCARSKLPPAADGTIYELEVCVLQGKELMVTFPDPLVGSKFSNDFTHTHDCKPIVLAKAGDTVPKTLSKVLEIKSESKVVIGQGKTCP